MASSVLHCPQKKNADFVEIKSSTRTTSAFKFSCRIFRSSALAPNFLFEAQFGKADMGSLVHSRQCGTVTAASVPFFKADLVAES